MTEIYLNKMKLHVVKTLIKKILLHLSGMIFYLYKRIEK